MLWRHHLNFLFFSTHTTGSGNLLHIKVHYPDAITNGLRRQTDIARSIIEKTRGDITFSIRGEHLEKALSQLSLQMTGDKGRKGPTLSRALDAQTEE